MSNMTFRSFRDLLEVLVNGGVEFVLIGGVAASVHGSARYTQDVDVVYNRTPDNIARLTIALAAIHPYLRGAPLGLPFHFDAATVKRGLNFTLTTDLGALDLLGEASGNGTYQALQAHSQTRLLLGLPCLCVDLPKLIELKRAAGRPKDYEALAELEALLEEQRLEEQRLEEQEHTP